MTRTAIIVAALLAAGAASAQSPVSPPATAPGQTSGTDGAPGVANSGPGSVTTMSTEGTGAGTISNNSAASSNAAMPSRAVPNAGTMK